MTPDELPSQPRKASWKRWMVVLAGVLAIALAVLLFKAPAPERVSVRFLRSTNENGVQRLFFEGTNGTDVKMVYISCITTNPAAWSRARLLPVATSDHTAGLALAREAFVFQLAAPAKE